MCVCVCLILVLHELYERIQRDSCVTVEERSISALGLFSVFPVVIPSKENSTFTCHFSFPKWAEEQSRRGAPGPAGQQCPHSATGLCGSLNGKQKRAEGCRVCVSMCMIAHDGRKTFYWRRAMRLGSGNASDVALEALRVFTFTTQQAARAVKQQLDMSVVQAHTKEQAQGSIFSMST